MFIRAIRFFSKNIIIFKINVLIILSVLKTKFSICDKRLILLPYIFMNKNGMNYFGQ